MVVYTELQQGTYRYVIYLIPKPTYNNSEIIKIYGIVVGINRLCYDPLLQYNPQYSKTLEWMYCNVELRAEM